MTDRDKGQIFAEYWARCGRRGHETVLDARKRRVAVEEARERGYTWTLSEGWVCAQCGKRAAH